MKIRTTIACAAALLLSACAGPRTTSPSPVTSYEIGTSRPELFQYEVPQLLTRLGYALERTDASPTNYRWTTMVRHRQVFGDEAGVRDAQMSLIITARRSALVSAGKEMFKLTLDVDSRVRVHPDSAWTPAHRTPELNRYTERLVQDFRVKFNTGDHLLREAPPAPAMGGGGRRRP